MGVTPETALLDEQLLFRQWEQNSAIAERSSRLAKEGAE